MQANEKLLRPWLVTHYTTLSWRTCMSLVFHCLSCEQEERQCKCDLKNYCTLCLGGEDVRLCEDGLYYCVPCREACDYKVSD